MEEILSTLESFFEPFDSLPFDDRAAEAYGEIRAHLTESGKMIGPHDLQIAAIAKSFGLTLVTHNVGEFSRVAELDLEDWQVSKT